MTQNYWKDLDARTKQSQKLRFNYIMSKIPTGPGVAEEDPIFVASPAHTITQAMIDQWNSGVGTETDPVFMAHVAHNLTSADLSKLHDTTNPLVDTNTLNAKLQDIVDAINALP